MGYELWSLMGLVLMSQTVMKMPEIWSVRVVVLEPKPRSLKLDE